MLAVAGGKGGCGKTTTTAGLAAALADRGAAPVVVDADRDMPDLHRIAGTRRDPGLDALAAGKPLQEVAQSAVELPGVRVVAGGSGDCRDVSTALSRVASTAAPVLVDTAAGAAPDVATPLRAADRVLIVSLPTPQSLADAAKTATMARELETPIGGVVLTRCADPVDPSPLLDCEVLGRVPAAPDPLVDDRVRTCYGSIASLIDKRKL